MNTIEYHFHGETAVDILWKRLPVVFALDRCPASQHKSLKTQLNEFDQTLPDQETVIKFQNYKQQHAVWERRHQDVNSKDQVCVSRNIMLLGVFTLVTRGWAASEFLTPVSKFNMTPNGAF